MYKPSPLEAYPHVMPLSVLWNDMDAMQHVNNTVYFRYLESSRIDFFRFASEIFPEPGKNDIENGIALAEVRCRFKVSLTYPDDIYVGAGVSEIGEHHFIVRQEIFSKKLGFIAAEGDARMVRYDYVNKRKATIEGAFLQQLETIRVAK